MEMQIEEDLKSTLGVQQTRKDLQKRKPLLVELIPRILYIKVINIYIHKYEYKIYILLTFVTSSD